MNQNNTPMRKDSSANKNQQESVLLNKTFSVAAERCRRRCYCVIASFGHCHCREHGDSLRRRRRLPLFTAAVALGIDELLQVRVDGRRGVVTRPRP